MFLDMDDKDGDGKLSYVEFKDGIMGKFSSS